MKKIIYLVLCIAGVILPYSQFIPFLREHGLDLSLFFQQLFANKVSGFFGMDVIVSSLALWVFVYSEGTRLKMRHLWIYVVGNLLIGVSLGLPLFLLMRQGKLDQSVNHS
jgi:Terpene cyclase DEP1